MRYDGVDYRYSSADADRSAGLRVVAGALGFAPATDGLDYLIALHAGGCGVRDRLAIRFMAGPSDWARLRERLRLLSPAEALASPDWGADFEHLLRGEANAGDIAAAASGFVEAHRQPFQDPAAASTAIAFAAESDVNAWCVVWAAGDWLNYLAFDQG